MKLLAVDGNSLINRAFYGVPILSNKKGEFTNAIYGFINMLNHISELEDFDLTAVAFDLKKPTFRHKMYAEYKAGRRPAPEELKEQFEPVKEYLRIMGYTVLECEGYEADDILGTLARMAAEQNSQCFIATGDRDAFQLVAPNVTVLHTVTKGGKPQIIKYTESEIFEKYGVTPPQLIDVKALQGDTSDNIPGVAGIGEKTACALIKQYESIENIYGNLDCVELKPALKLKLENGRENAELSYKLGKINTEVPIDANILNLSAKKPDLDAAARFFTRYELFSLLKKMNLTPTSSEETKSDEKQTFYKNEYFENCNGAVSVLFFENGIFVAADEKVYSLNFEQEREKIAKFLESSAEKSVYELKKAYHICDEYGFNLNGVVFDAALAGYLLDPSENGYELEKLALHHEISAPKTDREEIKNAALLCEIDKKLTEKIKSDDLTDLLKNVEIPLSRVLFGMEKRGFSVDTSEISKMGAQLGEKIKNTEKEIYALCGTEFNINSPKQLGEVLFEKLGLPAKKKTKSGYSTDAKTLDSLKDTHAVIPLILEYRTFAKLKSTYCDGLTKCADENGVVHSTLNQTETRTGRISSTEPNLQNIPVRTEEGAKLRKFFKARDGYVLVDADYSQIELRVLAHIAGDENMIAAFKNNEDIHLRTASQVFGLPESMVTPTLRSRAKAVNFGIVYGIGAFSLSKDLGVTRKEAAAYIDGYLAYYDGIAKYMDSVVEQAKQDGYVKTVFGRRRYLPELSSKNGMLRAFGERVARNMPIQGAAADIIKIAMVNVCKRFETENTDAHLIMQVHDELIVEARADIANSVAKILTEEMQNAAFLSVPLIADTGIGATWYEAKK